MALPAVAQQPCVLVLVQTDGALVRTESVFCDGQDEVRLIVIHLVAVVSGLSLLLVVPQDQYGSRRISQVRATEEVVLVGHTLLTLGSLRLANVVHNNDCYLVVTRCSRKPSNKALLCLKLAAQIDLH